MVLTHEFLNKYKNLPNFLRLMVKIQLYSKVNIIHRQLYKN